MSDEIAAQSKFWNNEAAAFERIYTHRKSALANFLDSVFRKDMYERFAFTIQNCEPVANRTFLDVGCGNGLYTFELVRRGAAKVVGLDIAEVMVKLCEQQSAAKNWADRCSFHHTDLLAFDGDDRFDVSFGIGLFDYIKDPLPVLKEMRRRTEDEVIASFPRLWTWRAPIRKVRLGIKGCGVVFYSASRIRKLMADAGFTKCSLTKVGKLYCVVAHS